ncbi:MAG: NAD-dependent deacylase [Nonlabens sp.]|nr:NAD-dependent deacylase [Nonlabens sp.]
MKNLVVLTGAGISAESGIATFRDADGLWEGHDVMEVATPEGFRKNPALVLDFYNQRRAQLNTVEPNAAHHTLAALEKHFNVRIITQNVDDLHERAGSSNIIHLHGELRKMRSVLNDDILPCDGDIKLGELCSRGGQLRPHIVWFGEDVPAMEPAIDITSQADYLLIVGTSLQVYPAAGLKDFVAPHVPIYFVDPRPSLASHGRLTVIAENASTGVEKVARILINTI